MLVCTLQQLRGSLEATVAEFSGYSVGIYQNAGTPSPTWTINDVVPCTFGGYSGPVPLTESTWTITLSGVTYVATYGKQLKWLATGGTVNTVYGYYVIDSGNFLRWIEPNPTGGQSVGPIGTGYVVSPRFTRRNQTT